MIGFSRLPKAGRKHMVKYRAQIPKEPPVKKRFSWFLKPMIIDC